MTPPITKEETEIRLPDDKFLVDLDSITMLMKKNFKDSGHLKSGRYFLPEAPLLYNKASKSGLSRNLALVASISPCVATYQHCYLEVLMVRLMSKSIDDNSLLKFQYCDNSFLFMNNGHPVGVIISTETDIDWLSTPSTQEKTIVERAMAIDSKYWSTLTIPNPICYFNHKLYFMGHLDNDNTLQDIGNVLSPVTPGVTDDLADSFEKLGKATANCYGG